MLNLNFTPFPVLNTERLILRQLDIADAANLFFVRTHPDVLVNTNMAVHQNVAETEAYIERILENEAKGIALMWAIALKNEPEKLIGTICYWNIEPENDRAETGYILHPDLHGKGLMGEAIKEVIPYGFSEMKLRSIIADIHKDNTASVKAVLRMGFVKQNALDDESDPDREVYVLESKPKCPC